MMKIRNFEGAVNRVGAWGRLTVASWTLWALLSGLALGQADLATLRVRVTDESKAIVPGAEVTLTDVGTNVSVVQVANDSGLATFAAVRPAEYTILVEVSGFSRLQITGVRLTVNERRLVEAVLRVANVEQSVEVVSSQVLHTEDGTLSSSFEKVALSELPLEQRRYTDLIGLVPGANVSASNGLSTRGYGWYVVNGNYATQNNFQLDGFDNNQGTTNIQALSAQVVRPSPDALGELKILTNSYSAEFGRGGGAVINASLKSGTNRFHGSGWWYNRDAALAANSWNSNLVGADKDPLKWNQFGGTLGGPIIKNKLFFFGDYERFKSETGSASRYTVPTPEMRNGVFPFPIIDPQTGQPFPNNTIPQERFDRLGAMIAALFPDPNTAGRVVTPGRTIQNFARTLTDTDTTDKFDIRIDYAINNSHSLFGRYSFVQQDVFLTPIFDGLLDGEGSRGTQFNRDQGLGMAWAWTLNPASINEFRFGYTIQDAYFAHNTINETTTAADFGFQGQPFEGQDFGGIPKIELSNYQTVGVRNYRPQSQKPEQYQFSDTWSYVTGRHLIKAGFSYRYKNNEFIDIRRRIPSYRFRGRFSGDDFADLLLGLADRIQLNTVPVVQQRQDAYAWFLQDDFKASDRVTLNLGLRYEYTTPFFAKGPVYNKNFDFTTGNLVVAPGLDPAGFGVVGDDKYLVDRDLNNWAPRLGVAVQVIPSKLVLRGGYGIFYAGEEFIGSEGNLPINPPSVLERSISGTFHLSDPLSGDLLSPSVFDTSTLNLRTQAKHNRTPLIQQFNVSLQWLLPWEQTLEVAYVGNRGRSLFGINSGNETPFGVNGNIPANRPYPNWGEIELIDTVTRSWFDSLQVSYRRRFRGGFAFNADYTYGSALNSGGAFTQGLVVPQIAGQYQRARNPEFSRHRATFYGIWELPIGRGRALGADMNRGLDAVIGGWQLSGTATFRSGLPSFWFLNPTGFTPDGQFYSYTDRNNGAFLYPNCVGDPNEGSSTRDRLHYLNLDAFEFPGVDHPGNCSPGAYRGPGFASFDLSLGKNFDFNESMRLQVRIDAFNAFNHTNYGQPFPLYGFPGLFGAILGARAPRDMQIGVRFTF